MFSFRPPWRGGLARGFRSTDVGRRQQFFSGSEITRNWELNMIDVFELNELLDDLTDPTGTHGTLAAHTASPCDTWKALRPKVLNLIDLLNTAGLLFPKAKLAAEALTAIQTLLDKLCSISSVAAQASPLANRLELALRPSAAAESPCEVWGRLRPVIVELITRCRRCRRNFQARASRPSAFHFGATRRRVVRDHCASAARLRGGRRPFVAPAWPRGVCAELPRQITLGFNHRSACGITPSSLSGLPSSAGRINSPPVSPAAEPSESWSLAEATNSRI